MARLFYMRARVLLVFVWFPITLILLVLNLAMLVRINQQAAIANKPTYFPFQITAASQGSGQVLGANIFPADARALLVSAFLEQYGSPLAPYADLIVQQADQRGIDFRLVPAIAMCESGGGRRLPTKDSFNAWGIAVYTGRLTGKKFNNWEHAISFVNEYLKNKYYQKGISQLRDIGAVWAPPSVESGHSWANCVGSFMEQMQ